MNARWLYPEKYRPHPTRYVIATRCIRFLVLLFLCNLCISQSRAQIPPPNAERDFLEAFQLYSDQLYEQAMQAFENFRETYPEHISSPEALFYQAESALAASQDEQAEYLFSLFQARHPGHPLAAQARLELGKYYYLSEQYDDAIRTLGRVIMHSPTDDVAANALYWMGESAMHLNNPTEALRYYQDAATNYPETEIAPVALYAVASTQIELGSPDEAVRFFELLSARYPNSSYTQNLGLALAEVYYELEDYQRAIDEVNMRMPNLDQAGQDKGTFILAESYNQLRNSDLAIVNYRKFTDNSPESPYYRRALFGLAWNYHFQSAYQWAADYFGRVLQTGQTDELTDKAMYYRAINLKMADQELEAQGILQDMVQQFPSSELADHALFELGLISYELRFWDRANEAFSELVRRYPNSDLMGEAYYYYGSTAIALGDFDNALRLFDRAISLEAAPASLKEEVLFQKAWLQYRSDNFQASAPAFLALHEQTPRTRVGGESLFWAAESFHQLGNYDRAVQLFRQYIRDFRGGQQAEAAHYALGWTYFRQGQYQSAISEFRTFLNNYTERSEYVPYRRDAMLRMADSYYALKQYPEAILGYQRITDEADRDYALYQTGQAYVNNGDAFDAINAFRDLLGNYPDSEWAEEAQYQLGFLYFQNENYEQAITSYQKLIADYPRDPLAAKAQYGIGDAEYNAGNLENSINAYQLVMNNYPDSPFAADAAGSIQTALILLGDQERAERIVENVTSQNPSSSLADELRFSQAEAKYQTGSSEQALLDFRRFIRDSENERLLAKAYYYLGIIYTDQGRIPEAEAYLTEILTRFPESPERIEATRRLGEMYLNQQRNQEALTTFRNLESLQTSAGGSIAQALYGQARALIRTGNLSEAEALLSDLAADNSAQAGPARLGLARVYEASGRNGEAISLYREVVQQNLDETGAESLYRLGDLLIRQGQYEMALEELGKMTVLYSGYADWIAESYLAQARAFIALERPGDAVQMLDRVIQDFRGTPYSERAEREKAAIQ